MNSLVFDIETGPLAWTHIEPFYQPPPELPPWDDSMCRMGNLKDPAKRAEKLAADRSAYEARLAGEAAARDEHRNQWAAEAALSPVTGEVLAIGAKKGDRVVTLGDEGESEPDILRAFWNVFHKYRLTGGRLIGFCSNRFDLPFIVWRSYLHAVDVPPAVFDKSGRYFAWNFVDLFDRMPRRGFENVGDGRRGLAAACRALGLGEKRLAGDAVQFAPLWRSGESASRATALDYLYHDLDLTWKLAERMGLLL